VTALERTAHPRFKRRPSAKELAEVYTPTAEELAFVRNMARDASPTLTLTVLLKLFERLGCETGRSPSSATSAPASDYCRTAHST
jgi:hypothetical protein